MAAVAGPRFDFAVIGAGIAGASVAAELAGRARVLLLEMESRPGYHATGRSAAVFAASYGPAPVRALARASLPFLRHPPAGFCEHPLLSDRGILMVADPHQGKVLDRLSAELSADTAVHLLDAAAARHLNPLLRADRIAAALYDPGGRDIDVHALHQGYLRLFRARGGRFVTRAQATGLTRKTGEWRISTPAGAFRAAVLVNAAGAWADLVAALAGMPGIGLQPRRRTVAVIAAPQGVRPNDWPLTVDCEEKFYMKPDAGRLLISPADETPSPPCDAQPEEIDIAIGIARIEAGFTIRVRHIESKWAGLRSFVADRSPVCGPDPHVAGFFWLAGQGGYGIQTAPALSRLAAALLCGESIPPDIAASGLRPESLSPLRLR